LIWADSGYNAWQVENLAETLAAFVTVASIQLAVRRPARA
jgi:hypothetical protein